MAIGRTHGSTDTEQTLASSSISDAYGSQQWHGSGTVHRERRKRSCRQGPILKGIWNGAFTRTQLARYKSVKWQSVSLAVLETIT